MKPIGEGLACVLTLIDIVGTIIITILCLNHSSESDSNDEITMVLINVIPQVFCFVLLIDFCIDDCCKNHKSGECDCCDGGGGGDCNCGGGGDCNCSGGGGGGDAGAGLAVVLLVLLAAFLIFVFFYGLTKGIGKNPSRICSLVTILFFEAIISIYCIHLYFMDEEGEKYVYIFGVSVGLSVANFVGLLIPCFRECSSDCCSLCWTSCCCCHSQRKSIINQPIVKQNNIIEQKQDLLSNDFETKPIPITPPSDNSSVESNYNSSIYNNYKPNTNIYGNNYLDNMAIDNITKPSNDFDNNIERTGSNYDIAPLPYDLPSEKEILEKYQTNNNNNY